MTTPANLTAADMTAIVEQIADGSAAVDSWGRQAAGGWMRPDDAREYWAHLPTTGPGQVQRVARVTVYRDSWWRWTIGDVDVFTTTEAHETARRDDDAAREILAAVAADPRKIVREETAAA